MHCLKLWWYFEEWKLFCFIIYYTKKNKYAYLLNKKDLTDKNHEKVVDLQIVVFCHFCLEKEITIRIILKGVLGPLVLGQNGNKQWKRERERERERERDR